MGDLLRSLGRRSRTIACALIAGIWRRRPAEEMEARIAGLPLRDQALIVGGVLAGLFLTSLLFAQGGWAGMLTFLLLVILVIN